MRTRTSLVTGAAVAVALGGAAYGITASHTHPTHAAQQGATVSQDTQPPFTAADHTVCQLLAGKHYTSPDDATGPVETAWSLYSQTTYVTNSTLLLVHDSITKDWPSQKAAGYAVAQYAAEDAKIINDDLDTLTADCAKAGAV